MRIRVLGIEATLGSISNHIKEQSIKQEERVVKKVIKSLHDATPKDTGAAADDWQKEKTVLLGTSIVNNKDYISKLNSGSSKQAPAYFVEKTILLEPEVKPDGTIVKYR